MKKIKLMLATLVKDPFDDPNWIFEYKWDGYRALANIEKGLVELYSRNLNPFRQFPSIVKALGKIGHDVILDGEIVAEEKGLSKFQTLQNFQTTGFGKVVYYVFDILYLDGHDLTHLTLKDRKTLLKKIFIRSSIVKLSKSIRRDGIELFKAAKKQGWEGIIAKDLNSNYLPGRRSESWLKIKSRLQQEAVLGGFTEPEGSRKFFGSLLLGVYDKNKFIYSGHAGTGFKYEVLKDLYQKMMKLKIDKSPFATIPKSRTKTTWIKPFLVGEVAFAEWTKDGIMRQASFLGLRPDKKPAEVRREIPK